MLVGTGLLIEMCSLLDQLVDLRNNHFGGLLYCTDHEAVVFFEPFLHIFSIENLCLFLVFCSSSNPQKLNVLGLNLSIPSCDEISCGDWLDPELLTDTLDVC